VVDAPWIAGHLADTGTHRGEFHGVEATGRFVSTPEFAFYRVEGGRIGEVWGMAFHVPLLEQIRSGEPGPAPAVSRAATKRSASP
jgi:predicted ester cyclase